MKGQTFPALMTYDLQKYFKDIDTIASQLFRRVAILYVKSLVSIVSEPALS
jgi:hypothetical protein